MFMMILERKTISARYLLTVLIAAGVMLLATHGARAQVPCEDCDECMTNCVCQPDGSCDGTPLPSTTGCEDGNPCTTGDHCNGAGSCVGGGYAPTTTQCTYYSDPCATNAHCDGGGRCVAGGSKNVDDPCSWGGTGLCVTGTCQNVQYLGLFCVIPCWDEDACHQCDPDTGQCTMNRCSSEPCSTGQCDEDTGECIPGNEGAECDDYDVCTSNDRCDSEGNCVGTAGGTPGPTSTPTATPSVSGCIGDCNNDSVITIDEILTGIDIVLGNADLSSCENFDGNGDGLVTVDEILTAVNNALNGCPQAEGTPTPTHGVPTSTPSHAAGTSTPTPPPVSPSPTTSAAAGTPSIGSRAAGTVESTTSALMVIPNMIAAIVGRLPSAGSGGSASLLPPVPFKCSGVPGGQVVCDQDTLFSPPTYTVTFTNCQLSGASGTLTINGTVTVADQVPEVCFSAAPIVATVNAQDLTVTMPNGTAASFTGFGATIAPSCSSDSCSCVADTVTLIPAGTITVVSGSTTTVVSFGDGSSISIAVSTFNAQCVPTVYDMVVNGPVTITTNGSEFKATYGAYTIHDDVSSGTDMVEVYGNVTSECFGDTVTFSTSTDIALGNPCPSGGVVEAYENTGGNTDTITFSSSGVDVNGTHFDNCLDPQLFACPAG
jgi:hypothetical protein